PLFLPAPRCSSQFHPHTSAESPLHSPAQARKCFPSAFSRQPSALPEKKFPCLPPASAQTIQTVSQSTPPPRPRLFVPSPVLQIHLPPISSHTRESSPLRPSASPAQTRPTPRKPPQPSRRMESPF